MSIFLKESYLLNPYFQLFGPQKYKFKWYILIETPRDSQEIGNEINDISEDFTQGYHYNAKMWGNNTFKNDFTFESSLFRPSCIYTMKVIFRTGIYV